MSLTSIDLQNELICERLLGWRRRPLVDGYPAFKWIPVSNDPTVIFATTPAFDTWQDAGVLLKALAAAGQRPILQQLDSNPEEWLCAGGEDGPLYGFEARGADGPAAIRAAALAYLSTQRTGAA